ncbi:MAG: substrate-binding domain-containing protein [Chloroflexi bacterium]|nr:substrate-binding domain-containing protein [Chloroflexota bacterium]MCH8161710.1 substrate-binding domain-containing protein [Chloroflexota bacterium]
MLRPAYRLGFVTLAGLLLLASACGSSDSLILATTTSTFDSGLLDELVPLFEEQTGFNVKVIAVGTGQALEMGRRGDADVLLVHAPAAEEQFVEEGYGVNRQLVMHNDFIIVGPASDPAELRSVPDAMSALRAIQTLEQTFVSRGDDSGTNKLELSIWAELGYDPTGEGWYLESGQGMGATLQIANQREAYTITDRATYLALLDVLDLEILHEGDPSLLNIYHVMQVNPERSSNVQGESAVAFVDFMLSDEAQAIIAEFGVEKFGQPLFVPDAGLTEADVRER